MPRLLSFDRPARAALLLVVLLAPALARAQGAAGSAAAAPPKAAPARDTLGRETPRGAVLGFMEAARKANDDLAPQYLNTPLRGVAANELAHKLFVVLDSRLPPRLRELSDSAEGGLGVPLQPDQDLVGTIATASGPLDVIVERVNRRESGSIW